jgi:hypothetical protein
VKAIDTPNVSRNFSPFLSFFGGPSSSPADHDMSGTQPRSLLARVRGPSELATDSPQQVSEFAQRHTDQRSNTSRALPWTARRCYSTTPLGHLRMLLNHSPSPHKNADQEFPWRTLVLLHHSLRHTITVLNGSAVSDTRVTQLFEQGGLLLFYI